VGKKPKGGVIYNAQLPAIDAYVAGVVTLRGKPCVHIRLGGFTHVIDAESALAFAVALTEQATVAVALGKGVEAVVEEHARQRATPPETQTPVKGEE
jgi:hypothetical protein